MTSTVTKDNRVAIPSPLATKYHIQPGAVLEWVEEAGDLLAVRVIPSRKALAEKLCGAGAHLQPERDVCAELAHEREAEDAERMGEL
jgi:bifunctional DNA-binding transcriptional regulator/antitoxin component of YhaV-PrlF toxin-antitoxin module